jgi:TPR repeat protein
MKQTIVLVVALAVAALACGKKDDKEARCTSVCAKIRDEDTAKCADEACKKAAADMFESCKGLCAAVASSKPGKSLGEQADDAEARCNKGDMEQCATIGGAYLLGKGGKPKDEKKGLELLQKSCDGNSAFGCEILGRAWDQGKGVGPDKDKAVELWTKACDGGSGGACRSLALKKDTSDPARIPLLEKACDKDDNLGCMGLGAAYMHGNQGAPKDMDKAKQFMKKACDLGAKSACDKLAELG